MADILTSLASLATKLDEKDLTKAADAVDGVSAQMSKLVRAQYLGIMRYWFANERCWGNCYRRKRADSPDTSAQKVWMECWDEYQDAIGDEAKAKQWAKYAEVDANVPPKVATKLATAFATKVASAIENGDDVGTAIVSNAESWKQQPFDALIRCSHVLAKVASSVDSKHPEVAKEAAAAADHVMKIASVIHLSQEYSDTAANVGTGVGGLLGGGLGALTGIGALPMGAAGAMLGRHVGRKAGDWYGRVTGKNDVHNSDQLQQLQQKMMYSLQNYLEHDPSLRNMRDTKTVQMLRQYMEPMRRQAERFARVAKMPQLVMQFTGVGFDQWLVKAVKAMNSAAGVGGPPGGGGGPPGGGGGPPGGPPGGGGWNPLAGWNPMSASPADLAAVIKYLKGLAGGKP